MLSIVIQPLEYKFKQGLRPCFMIFFFCRTRGTRGTAAVYTCSSAVFTLLLLAAGVFYWLWAGMPKSSDSDSQRFVGGGSRSACSALVYNRANSLRSSMKGQFFEIFNEFKYVLICFNELIILQLQCEVLLCSALFMSARAWCAQSQSSWSDAPPPGSASLICSDLSAEIGSSKDIVPTCWKMDRQLVQKTS